MSYARWGWGDPPSDVYVFLSVDGTLECCGCWLQGEEAFGSTDAMIAHLREHIAAGHSIPDELIPNLEADREENDAYIAQQAEHHRLGRDRRSTQGAPPTQVPSEQAVPGREAGTGASDG